MNVRGAFGIDDDDAYGGATYANFVTKVNELENWFLCRRCYVDVVGAMNLTGAYGPLFMF